MELWKPAQSKTAKIHWNEHTPAISYEPKQYNVHGSHAAILELLQPKHDFKKITLSSWADILSNAESSRNSFVSEPFLLGN